MTSKKVSDTPDHRCPRCDGRFNSVTRVGKGRGPKSGDLTICLYCTEVLIIADDLRGRLPLPGELDAAYRKQPGVEKYILTVQRSIRATDRRNAEGPRT